MKGDVMTFKTAWAKARRDYRNAKHGCRRAAWKALRDLVTAELRREIEAFCLGDWLQELLSQRGSDAAQWHDMLVRQALTQAARLWAEGRYGDYVETLAPVREWLSPAQRKRLSIAERRACA